MRNAESLLLHKDHGDIVKILSARDDDYKQVLSFLQIVVGDARRDKTLHAKLKAQGEDC